MAPAVVVQKKSGEIRLYVDYQELNKKTLKDAYPLPLPDEVQAKLTGATVFTTLDLQSGSWQIPVNPQDQPKTAYQAWAGPISILYAIQTNWYFMLISNINEPDFSGATICYHIILMTFWYIHLIRLNIYNILKQCLIAYAKLICHLRGRKCHIAMLQVPYLGHIFKGAGMSPDKQKVSAVKEWPTPQNSADVHTFQGLASYYGHYIQSFLNITKLLYELANTEEF